MALPAFNAAGTGTTGNPSWPTHTTGDFGILYVEHPDSTITTPSGWTLIGTVIGVANTVRLTAFYRFATSSSETAPTISGSADHNWSVIITYTGVNTSNPVHVASFSDYPDGGTTGLTTPGMTTLLDDCLIIAAYAWNIDNAGPLASAPTNADLSSLTERYDAGTITGNGGGLVVLDGGLATHKAFTFTSIDVSAATGAAVATIALQAVGKSFGTKSQIVNTQRRTMFVKQSTAQSWRFAMFDSADGVTGKTGLTLAVTIQKEGDTSFGSISPTVTEIGNGHYNAALTTTHMNTVGCTSLRATATGAIAADCPNCIDVIAFDKTDAAALGLSRIDAAVTSRLAPTTAGRTLDVSAGGEAGLDWANIGSPTTVQGLSGTTIKNSTDNATTEALIAGYIDTEITSIISSLASLTTAVAALPTATAVRDAILAYAYRSGRTVKGLFRRLGAALETADGLKGTTVNYYQPDGTTVEFSVSQNTTSGTRSSPVVTNSEA